MEVEQRLRQRFNPTLLTIEDESHLHAGHAEGGRGKHLRVTISSQQLCHQSRIQAHRVVYDALDDLFPEALHALSLKVSC